MLNNQYWFLPHFSPVACPHALLDYQSVQSCFMYFQVNNGRDADTFPCVVCYLTALPGASQMRNTYGNLLNIYISLDSIREAEPLGGSTDIYKSRDSNWPTKVCIVKAMVFPVVTYKCESWTIKKVECQRTDAFKLWCWRRLLRVPWMTRRSDQSILKESESHSVMSDSLWPHDYTVHGIHQARSLEWVAFPFSRGSSQPRDQTQVSHIAGGFFTRWATREAQEYWSG